MKYCCECGASMERVVPEGDNRPRAMCGSCDHIAYVNPRIVAGCVPFLGDSILMCRRAIEPGYGCWTLPAGFMEVGESLEGAARRELWEEAGARVEFGPLFAIVDLIHAEQVHFFYTGEMSAPRFTAGEESLEVRLFDMKDIPWEDIAFSSVRFALKKFIADRETSVEGLHHAVAPLPPGYSATGVRELGSIRHSQPHYYKYG